MPKILVFSGSTRPASYNRRLAAIAARDLAALGAEVKEISLDDYPLPFVDEDGRRNVPEAAKALRAEIDAHRGFFIACPEYNAGYTPLLKNAVDWASVAAAGPLFANKVVALGGASTGMRGGYRALTQFRAALELGYGALVIPEMASVPFAEKNLPDASGIQDPATANFLGVALKRLIAEASLVRG